MFTSMLLKSRSCTAARCGLHLAQLIAMRFVVLIFAFAAIACAHAESHPNVVSKPPSGDSSYRGRITLSHPRIADRVDDFVEAWTQRLSILGLGTRMTFDGERAVIDVFEGTGAGAHRSLAEVALVLSEPGPHRIGNRSAASGYALHWKLPTAACECVSILRTRFGNMDTFPSQGTALVKNDFESTSLELPRHRLICEDPISKKERPCTSSDSPNARIAIDFYFSVPAAEAEEVVLLLAGGAIPARPAIDSVEEGGR